jgi:hypothetical protein
VSSGTTFEIGDIAVDTDEVYKAGISQTITRVESSAAAESQRAIGVFSTAADTIQPYVAPQETSTTNMYGDTVTYQSKEQYDSRLAHFDRDVVDQFAADGKKVVYVNALGEGQINVCGENGNIAAGDLIVTSSTAGKGMKQDDDIVRSKTVAKAREAVTFASPTEVQQIACIYLCG